MIRPGEERTTISGDLMQPGRSTRSMRILYRGHIWVDGFREKFPEDPIVPNTIMTPDEKDEEI